VAVQENLREEIREMICRYCNRVAENSLDMAIVL
jgi:hypothetical protein